MTMFDDREDGPPRAAPGGATDSPATSLPGRPRTTLQLALAIGLFVLAGGLFYAHRGEWAEAFDAQAFAGHAPGRGRPPPISTWSVRPSRAMRSAAAGRRKTASRR